MQDKTVQRISRARLERVEQFLDITYVASGKLPGTLLQAWRRGEVVPNSVLGTSTSKSA
ncbi:hypothetical protein D3C87_2142950 [compost metagenome]|uniref:hypothetical protein n=1 Tax=Cupriavidus sp. SIMBA_020 TaxID=3085766 RepID=UPI000FADFCB6